MQPEVVTSNARSRMIEGKQWTMTILEIVNGKLVRAGRRRLTETFLSEKVFFEDFLCSIFSRCPAAYRFLDGSASAASHYRGGSGGGWGGAREGVTPPFSALFSIDSERRKRTDEELFAGRASWNSSLHFGSFSRPFAFRYVSFFLRPSVSLFLRSSYLTR